MNEKTKIVMNYTGISAIFAAALLSVGIYHTGSIVVEEITKRIKQMKENRKKQ